MSTETAPVTTPPVQVINNKGGDSLFGKIMTWVKKEGEMILVSLETEEGKIEIWLHESQIKPVTTNQPKAS